MSAEHSHLYVLNTANPVKPINSGEYQDGLQACSNQTIIDDIHHNLSLASAMIGEDTGCEHKVNNLLNHLVAFVLGVQVIIERGFTVEIKSTSDSLYRTSSWTIKRTDAIYVDGRETIGLKIGRKQLSLLPNEIQSISFR